MAFGANWCCQGVALQSWGHNVYAGEKFSYLLTVAALGGGAREGSKHASGLRVPGCNRQLQPLLGLILVLRYFIEPIAEVQRHSQEIARPLAYLRSTAQVLE